VQLFSPLTLGQLSPVTYLHSLIHHWHPPVLPKAHCSNLYQLIQVMLQFDCYSVAGSFHDLHITKVLITPPPNSSAS
jgi:hypothetical protein